MAYTTLTEESQNQFYSTPSLITR